jgi:Asp-tRNA(Asn)/Glu-tRNA(Gln) amidotransferase A subunit family amidase
MDPSIHAWVQVSRQKPTGHGKLAEIPFGAKDIIETRGLAIEFGAAIYTNRRPIVQIIGKRLVSNLAANEASWWNGGRF